MVSLKRGEAPAAADRRRRAPGRAAPGDSPPRPARSLPAPGQPVPGDSPSPQPASGRKVPRQPVPGDSRIRLAGQQVPGQPVPRASPSRPAPGQPVPGQRVPGESLPGRPGAGQPVPGGSARIDLGGVLRPVREGNAFEETVERLLTIIKLGMVAPGDKFPAERELAAQLGISRLTLREAIRELQEAGYVSSRRGRFGGTFVTYTRPAPDGSELRRLALQDGDKLADALTFRLAVETGAAEALASQLAQSAAPGIEQTLLSRLADVNAACPEDYRRLDTLFHLSIAELAGSSLLAAACADARWRLNDLLNAIPVLQRNIDHTAGQHQDIVQAILAGDAEGARHAVAEHLAGTAALLRGFLG